MTADVFKLAEEIIGGYRLSKDDNLSFLKEAPLEDLMEGADKLRKYFSGDSVDLCSIISGRNGACPEDCKYCAQSAYNHTGCEVYDLLEYDEIYALASANEKAGVDRFAVVISGHGPSDGDFDRIIDIYKRLRKDLKIELCASLGFLSEEQFARLYEAGVRSYHNNVETSPKRRHQLHKEHRRASCDRRCPAGCRTPAGYHADRHSVRRGGKCQCEHASCRAAGQRFFKRHLIPSSKRG